jgi:hypothetical protein
MINPRHAKKFRPQDTLISGQGEPGSSSSSYTRTFFTFFLSEVFFLIEAIINLLGNVKSGLRAIEFGVQMIFYL